MNALVPLQSKKRFLFRLMGGSWVIFDTARCRFIFPEWVTSEQTFNAAYYDCLMTKSEFLAQSERDFEEVLRIKSDFEGLLEAYLRAFAADHGIPYDLLIRPIPQVHEEEQWHK